MKKRILSIVLAVLMLVGIMPISALAADVEPPAAQTAVSTKTSENTTGPKLEKSAQWVDEEAGIAEITIKVTGEQPTQSTKKTDIVLVIDRSLSMTQYGRDWLDNAKKAAKAFAAKVLTGDPNVRIAVVAYAAKTIDDRDFSSNLATVKQHIDAINTENGNWHGTNIQAGIHSARERFKSTGDKDANKFMIVLADGAPNYRFTYKDWGIGTTFDLTDAQKRTYHINNWFSWLFYATSDAFNYNEVKNTEQYAYTAAASEAYAAKATDGITCYAIGYGIPQGNNEINALMYSISSTDAGFVNAGTSEDAITKVFSDIATDIQYKAHDVKLTDTMGAGFTYLANEAYQPSPVVTPSADNKTVTWNVADKLGDETKTLTFYVQYDKQNLTDAATLPTNTSASLSYEDNKGNAQTPITVDSPAIENLAKKVTYIDENDNVYTGGAYQEKLHWYGDTVTLAPAPQKDGYTFSGWTTSDVAIGENDNSFKMPKQNVTLKASWIKNTKTLTITKTWEGTTEKPAVTFLLTQKKDNVATGYAKLFVLDGIVDTEGEVVETAPWTATIEVPVKDTDGTEFVYSVKETKIGGTSIGAGAFNVTGTNPDNTSYIIGTWSVNSSGRPLDGTWTFTNKYAPKPQYTLTYEFVGENKPAVELPAAETLYEGQQTNLETVDAPEGWSFDGWYTDAGCTEGNKVTSPYTMPGSNMTLYGKWEQKQPGVTVEKTAKRIRNGIEEDLPSGTGTVRVDDTIKYTVKATNTGNVELRNVSILECFGGRNKFKDDKTEQTVSGLFDRYGFTIAQTLAPEATATRTFTYVVTDADEDYGVIKNHLSMQEATYFDGQKDAKIPPKTAPSHEVTVEKPHGVAYEFEAGLPEDLQEYLPEEDTGRYYKGDSVAVRNPKQNSATIGNTKYTFAGWYVGTEKVASPYTMGETNVTFVGKWTEQPPETISITVEKSWDTNGSESVVKPNVISVQLTQNGKIFGNPVDLSADVEWKHTFNDLPKVDDNGNLYTYSVVEQGSLDASDGNNVIGMWKPLIVQTDTTITITNTFETAEEPEETIDITVRKSWESETDNEDLKLPESVEVELLRNDEIIETATLHWRTDNYGHTFKDLPKYDGEGNEYTYTVKELGDKIAYNSENERIGTWEDTYEKTAEGWDIKNTFVADETPELEDHEFTAHIVKRFENKSGKSPKATFTFIAALKDGTEVGRETIRFAKGDVDAGKIGRDDVTMTVTLTDSQYEALEKDRIGRYLWIYEEDGEVDGVKYDTKPQKAYIYEKPVAWSLEFDEDGELVLSVPDETKLYCLVGDEMVEDFVFTNVYKKPGEKGETIKSGPQLNRDDHVAYIMGYPDGTVQPEGEITRAEACTIFFRLLTESSRDYYFARTNDYSDVNAGDWFNNAISTLSNAGIVTGYNDGTFRPNQPITRGEMAKIIANFANLKSGDKTFTDLAGHWSKTYVELAAGNGWIAGYPDGSFRPDQKITRAETVTMINRVLDRVPAKESRLLSRSIMLTFPDNKPGDWYYIAIQEASNSHEYRRSVYETTGDEMWTKLIDNVDWTKLEK